MKPEIREEATSIAKDVLSLAFKVNNAGSIEALLAAAVVGYETAMTESEDNYLAVKERLDEVERGIREVVEECGETGS